MQLERVIVAGDLKKGLAIMKVIVMKKLALKILGFASEGGEKGHGEVF